MDVNDVDTNGYHEPTNQLYAQSVKVHIGIKREKTKVIEKMRENNKIRIIKPSLVKTTSFINHDGKLCRVMRRDRTLTHIFRRIPV